MERLRQVAQQSDTVLFIGSGISRWAGLPTWADLVGELAAFVDHAGGHGDLVRREAERGDLLQAASYGFDFLTKHQIGEFIRSASRLGVAKPHDIHRSIVSLGPTCFITTNYDNLIEESVRLWLSERFFRPPITNRHLTALAEVVHASAVDFVFKPHGDAADTDSIVLTREQYRDLLPGGDRHAALESVKILLATRPVVYLGFGLRDPDFSYVRDLLANTYKGGTREHFAIMADVTESERQYWRRNYGIHLIGYETRQGSGSSRDHSELINLLQSLQKTKPRPEAQATSVSTARPEPLLALARHAARLTRHKQNDPEFPLRVNLLNRSSRLMRITGGSADFDHWRVEPFLDRGPQRAILVGSPGAGKTYSIHRAAARLAERLYELCMEDAPDEQKLMIPVVVDLKLYRGSVRALIEGTLPAGVFAAVTERQWKVKVFLDSFNEMPREHSESKQYEKDFSQFFKDLENVSIVVGSRSNDGLTKFELPTYALDEIDEEFVAAQLAERNVEIDGRFQQELYGLLQKPFYFHLYVNGAVSLPPEPHPRSFFESFFNGVGAEFETRFNVRLNLVSCLQRVAYDAVGSGEEAWPLERLLQLLAEEPQRNGGRTALDVANWLVSKGILVAYTGGRAAFFHQSVTEFLAATELARAYDADHHVLASKLSLTRWDQALFLTLSLLKEEKSNRFVESLIKADFALALRASKYVEHDRDSLVMKLLKRVPQQSQLLADDYRLEAALRHVPVSTIHELPLRDIMNCGNSLGGVAAERLVEIFGSEVKVELIQSLYERRDDWNYCVNGVAHALKGYIDQEDLVRLAALADALSGDLDLTAEEEEFHGFTGAVADLISSLPVTSIREAFLPSTDPIPEIYARILCDSLQDRRTTDGIELAADLLSRGVDRAATSIYFILKFSREGTSIDCSAFAQSHIDHLIKILSDHESQHWGLRALARVCAARGDLSPYVIRVANDMGGLLGAALLTAAGADAREILMEELKKIAAMSRSQRTAQPLHLLNQMRIDWTGYESLFAELLKLREARLCFDLIDHIRSIGPIDIGPMLSWLKWLQTQQGTTLEFMLFDRFARLIDEKASAAAREELLAEFNQQQTEFRDILANHMLLVRSDLTTDQFSDDAISFLMSRLRLAHKCRFQGDLLGRTATEAFVQQRLMGLLGENEEPMASNIREVLVQAGRRHGRRYTWT